uniref:Protein TOPAZ1 n=1 Tax=Oreochromis niloticus TaxID=8128 RepID=A0A669EFQ8_ORENI
MRASFRFWPTCLRHNESETVKKTLVKSSKCCPSAQDENTVCQSQSVIRQNHPDEGMHSQPLSHHTVSPFHRSQTGEASATCSASFLLDEHTNTGNCRGGMCDRDAEEDLGPGSDPVSSETCREKGKVGDSIECSSTLDFAPTDKCSASGGQKGDPTNADGSHVLSDLIDHVSDEETDAPESYTCQRVRAYLRKIHFSCARTDMAWPFSKTCTTNASTTAGTIDPSAKDGIDSGTVNQSMPGSSSNLFKDIPPKAPTEKWEEDGESVFAQGNEKGHRKDMETSPLFNQPEESETRPNSDTASFPPPAQCGRERGTDGVSASALLVNGPETVTSISTPSPSVLGLSDWDTATTLSPMSSPFTQGSVSSLSATTSSLPPSSLIPKRFNVADKILSSCEEAQTASSSPHVPLHTPDSFHSCESSILPQDEHANDKEPFPCRSPPRLEPYYCTSPFRGNASAGSPLCSISQEHCVESDSNEFMLPPLLSPVSSPQLQLCQRSFSCCSSSNTDEENMEEEEEEMNKAASNLPQNDNCNNETYDCLEHNIEESERVLSDFTTPETLREHQSSPSREEESAEEEDMEQGNGSSEQVSLHRKIKPSLSSGVLTEPCSSSSSDEENAAASSDGESHSDTEEGSSPSKIANREEDKIQVEAAGDSQPGILDELTAYEQDILLVDVMQDDPELFDNLPDQSLLKLGPTRAAEAPGTKPAAVVNTPRRDGPLCTLHAKLIARFCCVIHLPPFSSPALLLFSSGAVFTGYYQKNPPGVYFSLPIFFSLLWALLKAGMVSEVFSVLSVGLAHNIVVSVAVLTLTMEKTKQLINADMRLDGFPWCTVSRVSELGPFHCGNGGKSFTSFDSFVCKDGGALCSCVYICRLCQLCMKQEDWRRIGEVFRGICQSTQHPSQVERISGRIAVALLSEGKDKLSLPFSVFAETVCQNESEDSMVRSFIGRIGVSLMLRYHKTHQWAKGRRVVETLSVLKVCYSTLKGLFGNEDGASRCCLITVAAELFLLSGSVEGALNTLRENKWFLSSCSWPCEPADLESRTRVLIRLAEKTSHRDTLEVLCNLPGVFLFSPDSMDISRYSPLFNSHLQVCVDRQILPVASDTVDFMLSKNLAVDHTVLRILLQKLGKQNLWLRAREVFRRSLSVGYYPGVSAPPGFMTLIVPCRLGEVELALTFEMFITVNATVIHHLSEPTTSLTITLKRTQSCESEYLSAGSRLLSAACIPQPKLIVHYTAVNSEQEQVFMLDVSSARRWLRHNHLWAHEVWTH